MCSVPCAARSAMQCNAAQLSSGFCFSSRVLVPETDRQLAGFELESQLARAEGQQQQQGLGSRFS